MDFESYSAAYRPAIEERLAQLLPNPADEPKRLHEAMRYATLESGKRFRPLICLAACEAVGGNVMQALDAACAVEMVHCFSLIHDDLPSLDNDDLRRGRPTCHVVYGEAIALLAGDALFCRAFEILAGLDMDAKVRVSALQVLARASGTAGMVGGQTKDIESEGTAVDIAVVEWIHTRKTGALISAAAAIGALCGMGSQSQVELCGGIGMLVGHGFQIADDILNVTGSLESLGKPAGTDDQLRKATYPSVIGLDASRAVLERISGELDASLNAIGSPGSALAAVSRYGLARSS